MTEPKAILPKERGIQRVTTPAPDLGWYLLGWAGWVFLFAGLIDIGMAWVPFHFGNPEWEFGTVTQSLQSFAVPFLGAALIIAAGLARGKLWWGRVGVAVLVLMALWILAAGVLYALNVPVALKAVTQPLVRFGLKKAILRTALQVGLYEFASVMMVWLAWKALQKARHGLSS